MAKSSYLPHLLFGAVVCVCVYVAGDYLGSKEQGLRNKDGVVENLPTTRFFDHAGLVHKAAQNDTLFGVENLPTARFFAPTVQAQASSREKFFGATRLVRKAAQNDTLLDKIRHIYTAEIGIRETTGKNDGKRIEAYLTYVGLGKGNPWCAAFICWVYGKAGVTNPRSGWSPALFPEARIIWSRRRGVIKKSLLNIQHSDADPRRADIFGIWFQDKKRIAHCGFIDDWQEKYVITVEGNTNESGSREGDGVYRKRRLISTVYKVARWV